MLCVCSWIDSPSIVISHGEYATGSSACVGGLVNLTMPSDAQIQLLSGHASKQSLEIYQHLSLEAVEEAYQQAVKLLSLEDGRAGEQVQRRTLVRVRPTWPKFKNFSLPPGQDPGAAPGACDGPQCGPAWGVVDGAVAGADTLLFLCGPRGSGGMRHQGPCWVSANQARRVAEQSHGVPGRVLTRSGPGTPCRAKARAGRPWGKVVPPVSRPTVRLHLPMPLRMVSPAMGQKRHTGSGPWPGLGARPWQRAAHTIEGPPPPPCVHHYARAGTAARARRPPRGLARDCPLRAPRSAPAHGAVGIVFA